MADLTGHLPLGATIFSVHEEILGLGLPFVVILGSSMIFRCQGSHVEQAQTELLLCSC